MHPLLALDARPVIAHRGASGYAPENTLEAIQLAADLGADAFEFDVHVSSDGVPVVIHDPTLLRTCGETGTVRHLTAAQLAKADAGATFTDPDGRSWRNRDVRIPRLEDVLSAFPTIPVLIEIKAVEAQEAVREALRRTGATARAVVASFHWQALEVFSEPPSLVGASRRDIARLVARSLLRLPPGSPRCRMYAVPDRWHGYDVPNRRLLRTARRQGCPVHVWTVNDATQATSLWERGVAGIITNVPDVMLAVRSGKVQRVDKAPNG